MTRREFAITDADGDALLVDCDMAYGAPWPLSVQSAGPGGAMLEEGVGAWEHRNGYRPGWVSARVADVDAEENSCGDGAGGFGDDATIGGW